MLCCGGRWKGVKKCYLSTIYSTCFVSLLSLFSRCFGSIKGIGTEVVGSCRQYNCGTWEGVGKSARPCGWTIADGWFCSNSTDDSIARYGIDSTCSSVCTYYSLVLVVFVFYFFRCLLVELACRPAGVVVASLPYWASTAVFLTPTYRILVVVVVSLLISCVDTGGCWLCCLHGT